MGVPFRVVLYANDRTSAEAAATKAFQKAAELNNVFSDYEYDSELSRLSRSHNRPVKVSPVLWDILERSQNLAVQTEGAFDITVGPCASLWRKARRERQFPRSDYLQKALEATGYEKLSLDPASRTASLASARMRLDLGGIAKGAVLDAALKTLKNAGGDIAMIQAGGDIVAGAPPPDRDGWNIALASLKENAPSTEQVSLAHGALATSGDLFQFVELDGVRYSHVIDPRTGLGLTQGRMTWVTAADATTADAHATAIGVLGFRPARQIFKDAPIAFRVAEQSPDGTTRVRATKTFRSLSLRIPERRP